VPIGMPRYFKVRDTLFGHRQPPIHSVSRTPCRLRWQVPSALRVVRIPGQVVQGIPQEIHVTALPGGFGQSTARVAEHYKGTLSLCGSGLPLSQRRTVAGYGLLSR
jgi:hypothetical protein